MNRVEIYNNVFGENDRRAFLKACAENQLERLPEYKEVYGYAGYNQANGLIVDEKPIFSRKIRVVTELNEMSIKDLVEEFSAEFDCILSMING